MTTSSPLPPQDLDAERSVLGCLLLQADSLGEIAGILRERDFYGDPHAKIYRAWCDLDRCGVPADDVVLLRSEIDRRGWLTEVGGLTYLNQILETVPHAFHVRHYAKIVREMADLRRITAACVEAMRAAYAKGDPSEIIADAEQKLHEILGEANSSEAAPIQEALHEMFDQLSNGGSTLVSTGWSNLDDLLNGGLRDGAMYVIGARPSVGKTSVACNLTLSVASRRRGVLLFSLEQPRAEIAQRLTALISGVPVARIQSGQLDEVDLQKVNPDNNHLHNLPITIDECGRRTVAQISAISRLRRRQGNVDIIILDYIGLVTPDDPRAHQESQLSAISRGLKLMARDLKIPVVVLAQLNRSVENRDNKRHKLSDIRSSGAIEQDADAVIFISRDEEKSPDLLTLSVAKHRNGRKGDVRFRFEPELMRITPAELRSQGRLLK